MKLHKIIYASVIALAAGMGITSCDVNYDYPPVESPDMGGDGKWDAPLTVAGAYAYYNAYYSDAPDTDKYYWVTGYIVGCVNTTETVFTCTDQTAAFVEPFESQTNLLLAATPDCTDYTRCISLQLPSGAVRNTLNLNQNPTNLGRQVTVRGYIDKYLGIPGVRSLTHFEWGDKGIDTGDVEVGKSDYTLLSGDITSGRAYALVADNSAAQTVTAAGDNGFLYTEAVSISGNKFSASEKYGFMFTEVTAGSGQYYITDYKGMFLYQAPYGTGWSNRPSVAKQPMKDNTAFYWTAVKNDAGLWVISNVASGSILAYDTSYKSYGIYSALSDQYLAPELYEMANDPSIIPDFTPAEPAEPTDPEPSAGTIYQGLVANADDWTIENTSMPEAASYIWSWKEYNGSEYLNASCYISGTAYESQALAYTKVDLSGKSEATLTFEHAAKFQTTLKELCGAIVRVEGASAWNELAIPSWPEAGSWTFVSSGKISLKEYVGKKIEIGFIYGSSTSGSDTWEIKNFVITGK
ncbi:MAG: DUF6359 domain-containing protein [Bacteroidales bacterium]|nr:DUF6359 domain-containing protein [Bacteroidales bacterium]